VSSTREDVETKLVIAIRVAENKPMRYGIPDDLRWTTHAVNDANEIEEIYEEREFDADIRAGSAQARNRRAARRLLGLDDSHASADTP
jgi:hypothetical protein